MPSARRLHGDEGQVTTALLVLTVVAVAAVLLQAVLPLAGATDQRSRAQTAADAAALAAVDRLGDDVRESLERPLGFRGRRLGQLFDCGSGARSAGEFADRNGAVLTEYRRRCGASAGGSRVEVGVRTSDALPSGERSDALASAELDLPEDPCRLSADVDDLLRAYASAVAAAGAASDAVAAALAAAQRAAEQAQQAADDAIRRYEAGELTADQARALVEAAQQAADRAQQAVEDARDAAASAAGDVVSDATVEADCGPVELRLALDLSAASLTFDRVLRGDLDEVLEPRLVSDRTPPV